MSDNIFDNANIEGGTLTPWSGTNLDVRASSSSDISPSCPTAYALYLPMPTTPANAAVEAYGILFLDVTPGERYRITLVGAAKSGSSYQLKLGARQYDGSKGNISGYNSGNLPTVINVSSNWTTYTTILTVPSNAYYLSLGFRLEAISGQTPGGAFAATLLRAERLRDFVLTAPTAAQSSPRIIRSAREGYTLRDFDFQDSTRSGYQYSRDPAIADFAQVIQNAVSSGEKIVVPSWAKYRINSFPANVTESIISTRGIPIDIEGENHPIIEVGEFFWNKTTNEFGDGLFRFSGDKSISASDVNLATDAYNTVRVPFSMRGLRFSGSAFTNKYIFEKGEGADINSLNMVDISQFISPVVENCRFFGGYVAPTAARPTGTGRMDSGLTLHGNVGEQLRGLWIEGFADLGIYGSGIWVNFKNQSVAILTMKPNDKKIYVKLSNHGLTNNSLWGLSSGGNKTGIFLISNNWIVNPGQYVITFIDDDNFSFDSGLRNSATAPATAGTYSAPIDEFIFTDPSGDGDPLLSAPAALIQGCVIRRCTNAISYKRQAQGFTVLANHIEDVENGIRCASVPGAVFGNRASIIGNRLYRVSAHPIVAFGDTPLVDGNRIKNFGKNPITKTNTHNVSIAIAGIRLSLPTRGHVVNNTIINSDFWRAGIPGSTGNNVAGIKLETNGAYYETNYYDNIVGFNIIDGCYMPINESGPGFRNDFNYNKERNYTAASIYDGVAANGSVVRS